MESEGQYFAMFAPLAFLTKLCYTPIDPASQARLYDTCFLTAHTGLYLPTSSQDKHSGFSPRNGTKSLSR